MRLRSEVMLMILSAAMPEVFAADALNAPSTHALVHDSQGQPVISSSGECWHSSIAAPPGTTFATGCRALSQASVAVAPATGPGTQARTESAGPVGSPAGIATGSSQLATSASGSGAPAYVTDSRGLVVRGSSGDCWRTGTWTPAQATVVGCDGVLARALPVPAPAEPGKAEAAPPAGKAQPSAPPSTVAPSAAPPLTAPAPSAAERESAAPSSGAAPVPPVLPAPSAPGPATVAPGGMPQESTAPEPRSEKVTFDTDTFFDFDKSVLKPTGKAKLDKLAERLSDSAVEVVVAVGHTDSIGTAAYNQRLSERRAHTVVHYLREKGLPTKKIFSEGKGEAQPIASNASRAGRAKNRRVEVEVVAVRSKK